MLWILACKQGNPCIDDGSTGFITVLPCALPKEKEDPFMKPGRILESWKNGHIGDSWVDAKAFIKTHRAGYFRYWGQGMHGV